HTSLYLVRGPGRYELIGRTRDDAAGEAYDKVAKLLGLGYPGGPAIDRIAKQGDDRAFPFSVPRMTHRARGHPEISSPAGLLPPGLEGGVDFSFSGLKTAVMSTVKSLRPSDVGSRTPDIAASFQRVVVEALLDRTFELAGWLGAKSIGIAGGVSANSRL